MFHPSARVCWCVQGLRRAEPQFAAQPLQQIGSAQPLQQIGAPILPCRGGVVPDMSSLSTYTRTHITCVHTYTLYREHYTYIVCYAYLL